MDEGEILHGLESTSSDVGSIETATSGDVESVLGYFR
jgi:hypothetical protein